MPKKLVVDSTALIALERTNLTRFLNKINYKVIIPKAVKEEIKNKKILRVVEIQELRGKTLKNSRTLERLNIGKGEAQCCALANKLKLGFIICDDRKFIRQKFFLNSKLKDIKILGFSFFLHAFYKEKLIDDVWQHFERIIKLNNWERSEVLVANYTFLKESGVLKIGKINIVSA